MDIIAPLFLFALLGFPFGIIGYAVALLATGVFAFKQATLSPPKIIVYSLVITLWAVSFAYVTVAFFEFPFVLLCFGSVIASPISVIALPVIGFSRLPPQKVLQRHAVWLLMGWIASGMVIVSPVAGVTIAEICNNHHRQQLVPVTNALQRYYREHQDVPTTVSELVPTYLNELPVLACSQEVAYEMENCTWGYVLSMRGWISNQPDRYNPRSGQWATPNFLDGYCSFPK